MKKQFVSCRTFLLISLALPVMVAGSGILAAGDDEPTIAKDFVHVNAYTSSQYHKNYDLWSWMPQIEFRVNGPIASGSQLYAEFTLPGGGPWLKFDCPTGQIEKDYWWDAKCGGHDLPEEKGITSIGTSSFSIRMRNELTGTDATLFTGKIKVAKVHSNEGGPKAVLKWVYYVDHDWNLPIGYIFLQAADGPAGWKLPTFHVSFWVRGQINDPIEPHLFHQGKEVGKVFSGGDEVGKAGCGSDVELETTQSVDEKTPQKAKWARVKCTFYNVRGWDKTGEKNTLFAPPFTFSDNPGEYEFKVLWKGHLARSIKFTVGPEAKFDNGIATANKLGSDRVIVPVQVLGEQDGTWNKAAWKTDAFYGNPLTGFTPVQ